MPAINLRDIHLTAPGLLRCPSFNFPLITFVFESGTGCGTPVTAGRRLRARPNRWQYSPGVSRVFSRGTNVITGRFRLATCTHLRQSMRPIPIPLRRPPSSRDAFLTRSRRRSFVRSEDELFASRVHSLDSYLAACARGFVDAVSIRCTSNKSVSLLTHRVPTDSSHIKRKFLVIRCTQRR